jgi:hypothetical protein
VLQTIFNKAVILAIDGTDISEVLITNVSDTSTNSKIHRVVSSLGSSTSDTLVLYQINVIAQLFGYNTIQAMQQYLTNRLATSLIDGSFVNTLRSLGMDAGITYYENCTSTTIFLINAIGVYDSTIPTIIPSMIPKEKNLFHIPNVVSGYFLGSLILFIVLVTLLIVYFYYRKIYVQRIHDSDVNTFGVNRIANSIKGLNGLPHAANSYRNIFGVSGKSDFTSVESERLSGDNILPLLQPSSSNKRLKRNRNMKKVYVSNIP